jgi:hypothetical protein
LPACISCFVPRVTVHETCRRFQREALDAEFGLTDEVAPEHYRIALATLDLVPEVACDAPLLLVVDDAHSLDPPTADVLSGVRPVLGP